MRGPGVTRLLPQTFTPRSACLLLVPLLLTAAVFWPVRHFRFVELDDPQYIYANGALASVHGTAAVRYAFTTFLGGNWHPLVWGSYLFDRWAWSLRPGPMHVENAVLHALSGVLVLLLLTDATGAVGRATACAALFAVHPVHVESVAWVSERKDALSTVWLLAAACAYVRFARTGRRRSRWTWYGVLLAAYALSLSAKSMGVTLPGVLLLLDWWPLDRLRKEPRTEGTPEVSGFMPGSLKSGVPSARGAFGRLPLRVLEKLPLLAMAAATSAVTVIAQRSVGATAALDTDAAARLANCAVSYLRYVGDLFWPTGLAPFYPLHPIPAQAAIASVLILMLITAVAARAARGRPYLLLGWLWFAGTLLPVSGVVQVGMQARADRYAYFPSIGLSVAVVWLAGDLLAPLAWGGTALAVAVASAFTVAGRIQVGYWRDNLALFTRDAEVTEGNYVAWDELAREAINRGDYPTAETYLARSIDAMPNFGTAFADLGRCRLARGQGAGAVLAFTAAVNYAPASASYRANLALSLDAVGKHADAVAEARRAVALDPDSAAARAALARIAP